MEMVAEEFRVHFGFRIHDRAIHVSSQVHEKACTIEITVQGALATILPLAIDVGTVGCARASGTSELATVLTRTSRNICNASSTTVNAREHLAINALLVASSEERNGSLTTIA
jgi:hypothetical protein